MSLLDDMEATLKELENPIVLHEAKQYSVEVDIIIRDTVGCLAHSKAEARENAEQIARDRYSAFSEKIFEIDCGHVEEVG